MLLFDSSSTVREARDRFFRDNGFGDGGYEDRWVKLKLGPIPLRFPNTTQRRRAVPLHDLHHIATGYGTTWTGEAEISAWELGAGCRDYWAAWVLNAGGLAYGLFIAPRRVLLALKQGRRSRSLYHDGWNEELLEMTVGELRARLERPARQGES